jgi:hypothetical protein
MCRTQQSSLRENYVTSMTNTIQPKNKILLKTETRGLERNNVELLIKLHFVMCDMSVSEIMTFYNCLEQYRIGRISITYTKKKKTE